MTTLMFAISLALLPPIVASATDLTLSIGSLENGAIRGIDHAFLIDIYNYLNITAEFKNTGSTTYNAKIEIDIINWTYDTIASFSDVTVSLIPGESRVYKVSYLPLVSGYHWVHVKVTYGGNKFTEAYSSFYVRPYEAPLVPPITPPTVSPGVGPAPSAPPVEEGIPNMRLNYTDTIKVSKGQSYLAYLMVENYGTKYGNVSLNNIHFFAKSIGIPFIVAPDIIYRLETGDSAFFLITINVPRAIETGNYSFDFTVISDETSERGSIKINVEELPVSDEIWNTIQNYLFIIERLKWEIRQAFDDGVNVSVASGFVEEARKMVNDAIDAYNLGDIDKAGNLLTLAREAIEKAVLELALARTELLRVMLPAYFTILIIVIIALAVITLLFFYYSRKRKKEREAKQKEKAQ